MSEEYISLAEVRDLLTEEMEKREEEFNPVQKAALSHAQTIYKLSAEDSKSIREELMQIEFVTEPVAYKIADILPKYPEEVRAIFSKERVNLEEGDVNKILEIVAKHI